VRALSAAAVAASTEPATLAVAGSASYGKVPARCEEKRSVCTLAAAPLSTPHTLSS